jgi:DNA polymerase III epsilon subunit-like protein
MNKAQLEDDLGIALDDAPAPALAPSMPAVATRDRYIIVDTEGSGLFKFKDEAGNSVPADAPGQPRLAELVLIFVDEDLNIEREYQTYIRPEGWEMTPGATAVNKLTTEFLREKGIPVVEALGPYIAAVSEGRVVVCHNAQHDLKQIRAELRRAGLPDLFEGTRNICTMRALTDVCKIPPKSGRGGYKFPKLSEAAVFFGFDLLGDHTALADSHVTLKLFRKMRDLGVIPDAKVHFAKNPPEGKGATS